MSNIKLLFEESDVQNCELSYVKDSTLVVGCQCKCKVHYPILS
jgi:hypothetical protein